MRLPLLLPVTLAMFCGSTAAFAETRSATMAVSAVIQNNCNVSASPMAFAGTTDAAQAAIDGSAQINITCTAATAFSVDMDVGVNAAGEQRRMVSADGAYLQYQIFSDASRSKEWGAHNKSVSDEVRGASSKTLTAYGRITAVDLATPSGLYQDTITVTVSF